MAYRCPVCDVLQPDGEHLANHLAITAILDRDDHASWLAEHAPDYGDMGPTELAETVTPHVDPVDLEDESAMPNELPAGDEMESFDGAIRGQDGRERADPRDAGTGRDAETRAVLEEARELTAAMVGEADGDADGETNDAATEDEVASEGEETGDRTDAAENGEEQS
jgi:hypothetical protein